MTAQTGTVTLPTPDASRVSRLARRVIRGRVTDAAWVRPAYLGLLVATAALYFWNLTASGYANSFYSAAVQAGSVNWEAFFYGSSDAANSITVDKPPASLWFMALSVRIFGLSSFAILLPEVLMGVATVAVLFALVRRHYSPQTALLAGGALAITPVAALMFRFNNPDALLVLLLTLATYFTLRGVETAKVRWVVWAGAMVGLGFLTKQLQAFLILPVLAGVYLWASPARIGKRLLHLLAALAAVIVSAGWWVAVVQLVPASMRPYIGGSQSNNFLELTFGYNGFGRLTGDETGSVTGGTSNWGATGITRLFAAEFGGQIMWLFPAAIVLAVIGFVVLRRLPRVSAKRATLALLAGSLVVTFLVFSFAQGIFHAYYTVAMAPALAGTAAVGAALLWGERSHWWARVAASVVVLGSSAWAFVLLSQASSFVPWLKFVVIGLGMLSGLVVLVADRSKALAIAAISGSLAATLLGPLAYTIDTVATAHTGSIVTAGPTVSSGMGGGGGFGGARGMGGGTPPSNQGAGGTQSFQVGGGRGGFGAGGLLGGGDASSIVSSMLETDASSYTWVAAAVGSNNAANYQLATGDSVMPVGGFNGSDPSPTLAQFRAYVAAGEIHYFIGGTVGQSNGGSNASSEIAAWVASNFTAQTVDGVTVYDLTK
jgi:4-amino-4-deoxy-L-arabinose transferase-like glycosyltransferase